MSQRLPIVFQLASGRWLGLWSAMCGWNFLRLESWHIWWVTQGLGMHSARSPRFASFARSSLSVGMGRLRLGRLNPPPTKT